MLIGVTGKKRSGKDTLVKYLVDNHNVLRYGLADPIKQACQTIFQLTPEEMSEEHKEKIVERWNMTPRQIFQIFGTEGMRNGFGQACAEKGWWKKEEAENIWIKLACVFDSTHNKHTAISDVRFNNEAKVVLQQGGVIISVENPTVATNDSHASEAGLSKDLLKRFPNQVYSIQNNPTKNSIEDFFDRVEILWQDILSKHVK